MEQTQLRVLPPALRMADPQGRAQDLSTEEQSPAFHPCLQQLQIQAFWGRYPLAVFTNLLKFRAINMKLITEAEHLKHSQAIRPLENHTKASNFRNN